MNITLDAPDKTVLRLTPEQGVQIRELIVQQIDVSFRYYVHNKIGLEDSNVSAILSGKRNTTIAMIKRLLSGTRIEVTQCTLNFTLENTSGGIVQTAASPTLEEMLSLREQNESGEDEEQPTYLEATPPTTRTDSPSHAPSSSSEKPLGKLKTLLASRSWENQDESSE